MLLRTYANSLGVLKVMDPARSKHVYLGEEHNIGTHGGLS